MDVAPWVWVVVGIVVVVLVVVFLVTGQRRRALERKRDESNREKAAEMRRKAEDVELEARENEARASRARADAEQAQVQAARLKQEAEQKTGDARSLRDDVARQTEKANAIDPDVRQDEDQRPGRDGAPGWNRDSRRDLSQDAGRDDSAGGVRQAEARPDVGPASRTTDARTMDTRTAGAQGDHLRSRETYGGDHGAGDTRPGEMPTADSRSRGDVTGEGDPYVDAGDGSEPAQAEELRRRRERSDRDTPRSGI